MRRIACLLLVTLRPGVAAFAGSVRENSEVEEAFAVPRGEQRVLMTEIWTVRADGSDPMWIKTYLGEPGGLLFFHISVRSSISNAACVRQLSAGTLLVVIPFQWCGIGCGGSHPTVRTRPSGHFRPIFTLNK